MDYLLPFTSSRFVVLCSLQAIKAMNPYLGFSSVGGPVVPFTGIYGTIPEKSSKSLVPMPGQLPGDYKKELCVM